MANQEVVIKQAVIKAMKDDNKFREQGFSLHPKFIGKYTNFQVVYQKQGDKAERDNNFRLRCKSASGQHSLSGFMFSNALVVPKDTEFPKEGVKEGVVGVCYFDQASEVTRNAERMHQLMDDDKDFKLPESFTVLGACVGKDSVKDHPYIPISRYPRYHALLNHHKKLNPTAEYINRDDIEYYLGLEGDARPKGIPDGFKFELRNHEEAVWEMHHWMPTLVIQDWRESNE